MTEASPRDATRSAPTATYTSPGTIGPPLANTECRIVDPETGEDAAPGEHGELWIRGPQVMKGYLNNAEATADHGRRRRLAAHRRHRRTSTTTAASPSSTGSRS